jgi:hypothetical protein
MKEIDDHRLMEKYCETTGKYILYIHLLVDEHPPEEYIKAAPWLKLHEHFNVFMEGYGYFEFDTEEEMYAVYNQTVGDDGPTKLNPYNGPARIYALTCGPRGLQNENT